MPLRNSPERKAYMKEYLSRYNAAHREEKLARDKLYREANKPAAKKAFEAWELRNPDYAQARKLMKYWPEGSMWEALDNYRRLLANQNSLCACCGESETLFDKRANKIRRLSVDHCHKTGKVRGLLCAACNHGVGKFKDSPDRLQKAIDYLQSRS